MQFCNDNSSLLYLGDCLPGSTGCPQGHGFYFPANTHLPPSHAGDAMSCSAGYSPLLATVDFHSDVRSDLALLDLFVTSARLSQVRLCTQTTFCGAPDLFFFYWVEHFISHREGMKRRAFRPAGLREAFILWRNFLYFGAKVPGVIKVTLLFLSVWRRGLKSPWGLCTAIYDHRNVIPVPIFAPLKGQHLQSRWSSWLGSQGWTEALL